MRRPFLYPAFYLGESLMRARRNALVGTPSGHNPLPRSAGGFAPPLMHAFSHRWSARSFVRWILVLISPALALAQVDPRAVVASPGLKNSAARTLPRRAVVEGLTESLQNLRITDLNGRDISPQVEAKSENGKITLDLAQPTAVVLKSKNIATMKVPATSRLVLPGGAVAPLSASSSSGNEKAVWFRLTFAASPIPAPWQPEENGYLTQLTFGLKRPDGAPATLKLDQPVIVKLGYQGLVAPEIAMISIDAPGIENEKTIPLRFTPQSPNPTLLVRSTLSDVNLELSAVPRLSILADRDSFLGLGLDVINVTIANVHPDGSDAMVDHDTPVAVTVEGGPRLESDSIVLRKGDSSTRLALRSSGLKKVTVRANANGILGVTTLRQDFPTTPLLLALVGGAIGGFARQFLKGAHRAAKRRRVLEGIVVASIAFVAGVLGVGYFDLPSGIVATEAGAFLTGAVAGFAGVSVLELMAKRKSQE